MTSSHGSNPQYRLRYGLFLIAAFFIFFGPFYKQVLHGRSPLFRQWRMYSAIGMGIYDVKYVRRTPLQDFQVNRIEILKKMSPKNQSYLNPKLIQSPRALAVMNQIICQYYGARADVRLWARVATPQGWKRISNGEANLCSAKGQNFFMKK